jgi:hypothetical protein
MGASLVLRRCFLLDVNEFRDALNVVHILLKLRVRSHKQSDNLIKAQSVRQR